MGRKRLCYNHPDEDIFMRILISNDDGIEAPGLKALVNAFAAVHEVYVCAPAQQQSSASHRSTLRRQAEITVKEYTVTGCVKAWAVEGSPADCVYLAVNVLMPRPDIVLAGVNRGFNLSTDCIYSGTVGAASEGLILGIPAMAVSLVTAGRDGHYEAAASIAEKLLPRYLDDPDRLQYLMNINAPDLPEEQFKGVLACGFDGTRIYDRKLQKSTAEDGADRYHVENIQVSLKDSPHSLDGDVTACAEGYCAVTPVRLDWTDRRKLKQMREWPELTAIDAKPAATALKKENRSTVVSQKIQNLSGQWSDREQQLQKGWNRRYLIEILAAFLLILIYVIWRMNA